jgi:hypothetical protein
LTEFGQSKSKDLDIIPRNPGDGPAKRDNFRGNEQGDLLNLSNHSQGARGADDNTTKEFQQSKTFHTSTAVGS